MVILIDIFSINRSWGYEKFCIGYYCNRDFLCWRLPPRRAKWLLLSVIKVFFLVLFWYYCGVVMVILLFIFHFYHFIYVQHAFCIWNITDFTKTSADLIAFLIPTKASSTSSVQEKERSCLSILWIGLTITAKSGTNLWTKLITPIKSWTSFLEVGASKLRIASILSGSMLIPKSETMCPRSLPSITSKID